MSDWQRHLLSVGEGRIEGEMTVTVETLLVGVGVAAVLVLLVMLCVCNKNSSPKPDREQNGAALNNLNASDQAAVIVDEGGGGETSRAVGSPGEMSPNSNGVAGGRNSNNSANTHSRQASGGSGQMRPTSLRELPDLPGASHKRNHSGAGLGDKVAAARNGQHAEASGQTADSNSYDHLGAKFGTSKTAAKNYDHITLDSPRDCGSGPATLSEGEVVQDGHYAQVQERTYDVVQDVRNRASQNTGATTDTDFDPYAKVKEVEEDDKEDPYAKVKDGDKDDDDGDDDYAHLRHDHPGAPSASVVSPAGQDDEDPYERVMGDSAGTQAQAMGSMSDPDDPYARVNDQPNLTVVPVRGKLPNSREGSKISSSPTGVEAMHSDRNGAPRHSGTRSMMLSGAGTGGGQVSAGKEFHLQYADQAEGRDDYAVVVKDRERFGSGAGVGSAEGGEEVEEEIEPYFSTPPEPPRMYGASEVGSPQATLGGDGISADGSASPRHQGKEHRYTKVTARESLASMSARNALNMYEIVPDLPENTYATELRATIVYPDALTSIRIDPSGSELSVEGGSGDGEVGYTRAAQPSLQHSNSRASETYAEIGASATAGTRPTASAPEPPSLDSLHSMTKSTTSADGDRDQGNSLMPGSPSGFHGNRGAGSPSGGGGNARVVVNDDGYAVVSKTSNFSPSETALPQIPQPTPSDSLHSLSSLGQEVTINGVTLHPDYHRVKDCIPDQDSENDHNYESVDEALAKASGSFSQADAGSRSSAAGSGSGAKVTGLKQPSTPTRRAHEYEEVSPPTSPSQLSAGQGSGGINVSPGASGNSSVSPGFAAPPGQSSRGAGNGSSAGSAQAAEVRERVLQGHMYEDIADVKKKHGSGV